MFAASEDDIAGRMFDASNHGVGGAVFDHLAGASKIRGGKGSNFGPRMRKMSERTAGAPELVLRRNRLADNGVVELGKDDF